VIQVANLLSLVTIPEILVDPNEEFGLARAPGDFATGINFDSSADENTQTETTRPQYETLKNCALVDIDEPVRTGGA
jgi:hypothetical protein